MKRIILLITLTFITVLTRAQVLLSPDGLISTVDQSKNYLVFEYDGISKNDLYKNLLLFVQKTYKSPDDVISEVPNESIAIRGFQPRLIGIPYKSNLDKKLIGKYAYTFDMSYNFVVHVKDNKIRVELPTFECYRILNGGTKARLLQVGKKGFLSDDVFIYSEKDGKLKQEDAKSQIESFFNNLLTSLKDYPLIKHNEDLEW